MSPVFNLAHTGVGHTPQGNRNAVFGFECSDEAKVARNLTTRTPWCKQNEYPTASILWINAFIVIAAAHRWVRFSFAKRECGDEKVNTPTFQSTLRTLHVTRIEEIPQYRYSKQYARQTAKLIYVLVKALRRVCSLPSVDTDALAQRILQIDIHF